MDSPVDKKGQRRGLCGHIMAAFDLHKKCARCRDKGIGDDPCVKDKQCSVCDSFSDEQRELICTPSYRIRKERKAGILVSPKEVEVIAPIYSSDATEPTFSAPPQVSSQPSISNFVTAEQFSLMNDKWAEQFARFEALLSRGNVFSTPESTVNPISAKMVVSDSPFIAPAARPTGLVETPAVQEAVTKVKKPKDKKQKKTAKSDKPVQVEKPGYAIGSSGPEVVGQAPVHKKADPPASSVSFQPEDSQAGPPEDSPLVRPSSVIPESFTGAFNLPPEPDEIDFDDPLAGSDVSTDHSGYDEGEISSDNIERPDQTEEMNYRETVRSIRSFMGWTHVPDFESDLNEPDKS